MGKALAQTVIENGGFVIGTFRKQSQIDEFNIKHHGKGLGIKLDLTDPVEIQKALEIVTTQFDRLDVLVNNAGVGFAGAIEETSEEEARAVFEANFFGVLALTRAFLPVFRKQKSGHVFQISSHGGIKAFAGFGIYNASKFALEGFSEALAQEIAPLGIKLTIVEPGPFRTSFAGDAFRLANTVIDDYKPTAGVFKEKIKGIDGKQEGDPKKAGQAILKIANADHPPLRLPLGKIALGTIMAKIDSIQSDVKANLELAQSAVF